MPHVTIYALCRSSGVLCRKSARADVTNADLPKPTDQMPIRIEKRCSSRVIGWGCLTHTHTPARGRWRNSPAAARRRAAAGAAGASFSRLGEGSTGS